MNPKNCPTCQAPVPPNAPGGFCPACLLRSAEEPEANSLGSPSLEEIALAFPNLEIIRLIGRGGMGYVYQARQPGLDRDIALKILSPELGSDPAFAERFAREARTLGKITHPNIVAIHEHGESGGFFYLFMEYVDGVNLREAMRAGRFTPEQALAIVPPICDALQAAHAKGIWHRDIKPENILLDAKGGVKIADFGIARLVGDPQRNFTLTMTGGALGSAAYMAPEQYEKPHDVDHRADIYSLGVVIYEMLTGELPLGRFPAPSQRAEVNARIDEIVFRTLEKERDLRQQSADEVKTEMQGADSRSMSTPQSAIRDEPASQTLWSLGLMLCGVAVFVAAAVFTFGQVQNVLLTLAIVAFVFGWIVGCLAISGMRHGRISRAWRGRLLFVLWLPAVAAFLVGGGSILTYQNLQTMEAPDVSEAVKFQFNHPEDSGGCGMVLPAKVSKGWRPANGQSISLKSGGEVWVRVRLAEINPNWVLAVAASSADGEKWEIQTVSLERDEPTKQIHFRNGTIATVSLYTIGRNTPAKTPKSDPSTALKEWKIDQAYLAKPKLVDEEKDWAPLHEYIKDGDMRAERGDLTGALESYRAAGEIIARNQQERPEASQNIQAECLARTGDVLCMQEKLPEALESYRASGIILARLLEKTPESDRLRNALTHVLVKLGDVHQTTGNLPEATRSYRQAVAVAEKLGKDWETEYPLNGYGSKLARNYKATEVFRLIDAPDRDSWDLMWMIGQAGANKDDSLLPLLERKDLPEDATLALALAGYDFCLNSNRSGLDFILAELSKQKVGADVNEVCVLSFLDEWDRSTKAVNSHFPATDGTGGDCMLAFWARRMLLFPRNYLEFRGLAGEGAPIPPGKQSHQATPPRQKAESRK